MQTYSIGNTVDSVTGWIDMTGYDAALFGISANVTSDTFVIEGVVDGTTVDSVPTNPGPLFLGNLGTSNRRSIVQGLQITTTAGSITAGPAIIAFVRVRRTAVGAGTTTIFVVPVANAGEQTPGVIVVNDTPGNLSSWLDVSNSDKIVIGASATGTWGVGDRVMIEQDVDTASSQGTPVGEVTYGTQLVLQGPVGVIAARRVAVSGSIPTAGLTVQVARSAYPYGSGGGSYPVPGANNQAAWFIDNLNTSGHANDSNPGTLALPLLTTSEWLNRLGQQAVTISMTINYMSDDNHPYVMSPTTAAGGSITFQATAAALVTGIQNLSVSITENIAWAPVSATNGKYTLSGGTPAVSGSTLAAAVAGGWHMVDNSTGTPNFNNTAPIPIDLGAIATETVFANGVTPNPVASAVNLYSMPKLGSVLFINPQGTGFLFFVDLNLGATSGTSVTSSGTVEFLRCSFKGLSTSAAQTILVSSTVSATSAAAKSLIQSNGTVICVGSCIGVNNSTISVFLYGPSSFIVTNLGGTGFSLILGQVNLGADSQNIASAGAGRSFMGVALSGNVNALCIANYITALIINPGQTFAAEGWLFFSNNSSFGASPTSVAVKSTGALIYNTTGVPVINPSGGAADFKVGGTNKVVGTLPFVNATNLAAIVLNA